MIDLAANVSYWEIDHDPFIEICFKFRGAQLRTRINFEIL